MAKPRARETNTSLNIEASKHRHANRGDPNHFYVAP